METYNKPPIYNQAYQPVYLPIPLKPLKPERKFIRHYYNWAGACIIFFFALIFTFSILSYTISAIMGNEIREGGVPYVVLNLACTAAAMLLSTFICSLATKTPIHKLFNLRDVKLSTVGKITIADFGVVAVMLLISGGLQLLFGLLGIQETSNPDIDPGLATAIDVAYACIGAPIVEELMFRGFILKNLSRVSVRFGIFSSALLFGLLHGNTTQFLVASAGGILLAYIAVKSNSIIPSIMCHALYNTTLCIFDYIYQWNETIGDITTIAWFILTAILTIIIIVVSRKKINFPQTTPAKKKRTLPLFLTSPTILISLAFLIYTIITNFEAIS